MDNAPHGLAAVFMENRAALLRFAKARLRSTIDADDVLQDIWLKLRDLHIGAPVNDPLAYLFKLTENAIRDRIRADSRRRKRESSWMEDAPASPAQALSETSPERIVIEHDRLRRVEHQFAQLPERTRLIFQAFRLEGRKQSEIAAELSIGISAVEKHLQRAYKTIGDARRQDDADFEAE